MLGIIIAIFVVIIIAISVVAIYLSKNRSYESKGKRGENLVSKVLEQFVGENGIIINDYVFNGQVRSVQIDHILISEYGVYVIETKNYSGTIYGEQNQREWLQVLAGGNVKNKFFNPLKQNSGHIYQLRRILPKNIPIFGIVVFVQNNIQNIQIPGVVPLDRLIAYLQVISKDKVLTKEKIDEIYDILIESRNTEISNEEHVQEIREMVIGVESNTVCPRCGSKLVLRNGKNGQFMGCSGYPQCKFTKNIF